MNELTQLIAACPECAAELQVPSDVLNGEVVPCEGCDADLEVVETRPLQLQLAPEIEEDWGE